MHIEMKILVLIISFLYKKAESLYGVEIILSFLRTP